MRILVADFLFVDTHKDMNVNFINAISRFAEVDVISLNGYYDMEKPPFNQGGIKIIVINLKKRTGAFGFRLFSLDLMNKTAAFTKRSNYDAVLCLGFETTIFGLGLPNFKRIPLFIFHHKNIDELTSRMKRIAYKSYKEKVFHVVFEEFFRDRLVKEIGVSKHRVYTIPHPAKPIKSVSTNKSFDCIGLCNSNDENFIKEAVERETDFEEHGFHILLRSKIQEKRGGAVEVIKGFMEKEVYDELMAAGKTVFVPLPESYIYRLSGSIYDGLTRGKPVFTNSKYYAQEYERRYPGTCQYIGSVEQLIQRLQEQEDNVVSASFQKFIEGHSIETVSRDIELMFRTVLERQGHE